MSAHISRPSPLYTTPLQFQIIEQRLFRGIYPTKENLEFLKTLNLKTVITILPDGFDISTETPFYDTFLSKNNINLCQFQGNIKWKKKEKAKDKSKEKVKLLVSKKTDSENVKRRDKTVGISEDEILKIIDIVSDPSSYPIFIHDLTNETVTPLIVAIFRKLAYWNLVSIVDEFIKYSGSINVHERKFIEEFPIKKVKPLKTETNDDNTESKDVSSVTSWIRRVGI